MAKVRQIDRTTVQVEIYVGEVECEECETVNIITNSDKDDICIECKKCNKEILCEWIG